jgi:hypothetical protein
MNRLIYAVAYAVALASVLSACAGKTDVAPSAQLYRGEVWTWDERENIVTLRMGAENVRVKTTPDQIRQLRLHEIATVRGELAPPADVVNVMTPPRPMRAIPQGATVQSEVTGTVSASDPKGLVSIDTPTGRFMVWTATANTSQFPAGTPVRVKTMVTPVRYVPADDATAVAAAPDPSASVPTTEPGEHALVIGRVLSVGTTGVITVESPRGPIAVLAPNVAAAAGAPVQVRTSIVRAQ